MPAVSEKVLGCVYAAIDEVNEDREDLPPLKRSPETPIHGPASELDSLGLINFLVAVEERLEEDFGAVVSLSDERAISERPSPFESVRTLTEYVEELLRERQLPT